MADVGPNDILFQVVEDLREEMDGEKPTAEQLAKALGVPVNEAQEILDDLYSTESEQLLEWHQQVGPKAKRVKKSKEVPPAVPPTGFEEAEPVEGAEPGAPLGDTQVELPNTPDDTQMDEPSPPKLVAPTEVRLPPPEQSAALLARAGGGFGP